MSSKYNKYKTPELEQLLFRTSQETERIAILAELKVRYYKEYSRIQPPKEKNKGCLVNFMILSFVILLSFTIIIHL